MKYINLFILAVILLSCSDNNKTPILNELKVEINAQKVFVKDIFDKFEVIPLETTDSNLMIWPERILLQEGNINIFDIRHPAIFVYSENGKFLRKIGKKGEGPTEYREIYDADIDAQTGNIQMLSPFGELFVYNQNGAFVERLRLPDRLNYQAFQDVGDSWITWTSVAEKDDLGISVISKSTKKCTKGFWKGNSNLNSLYPRSFHKYNHSLFFFKQFDRKVYEISKDSMLVAYQWNFQGDNYDIVENGFSREIGKGAEEFDLLIKYLQDSTIPYFIERQNQTNKYYYALLVFDFNPHKVRHIFYRKSDGKSFVFQQTSEGIEINPLFFTDEYMLCLVSDNDIEKYKGVLSASEFAKLAKRGEEENPYIVKYYFK